MLYEYKMANVITVIVMNIKWQKNNFHCYTNIQYKKLLLYRTLNYYVTHNMVHQSNIITLLNTK